MLPHLGYALGDDGNWRGPQGHTFGDAELDDGHFLVTLEVLLRRASGFLGF